MELTIPQRVWNRACLEGGGPEPKEGDRALADLILFHGMVMNGGLGHACKDDEDQRRCEGATALSGYRFFGFSELADFVDSVADMPEETLEDISGKYNEFVPDDSAIADRFESHFNSDPSAFAPL